MSRKDELQAEWHKLHALKGDERHPLGGYLPRAVEALDNGDTRECRNMLMLALYGYALPGSYRCPIAGAVSELRAVVSSGAGEPHPTAEQQEQGGHTPGPWEALPYTRKHRCITVRHDYNSGEGVAEIAPLRKTDGSELIPWEQFEANAKLMISAPRLQAERDALLAACKRLRENIEDPDESTADYVRAAFKAADAAIALCEDRGDG